MGGIYRKQGTRYFWAWGRTVDGKQWDESTKQTERKAAQLAAREIGRRYAANPRHKEESRLTVARTVELVLEYQRNSKKADGTIAATTYHGRHLVEHLGANTMLVSLTLADTTSYLRKRRAEGGGAHTIKKEIKTLMQGMRRAAKLGHYVPRLAPEHFMPDELTNVYEPRDRWLTRDEYAALLAALAPRPLPARNQRVPSARRQRPEREDRRDYVIAWCHLGLRMSELFDIEPGDFNAKAKPLPLLRVRGTKTEGADRMVPVNDTAAEVLARRCERPVPFPEWGKGNLHRDLKAACKRAGIAECGPNDFRRTFCSWLCQAGVSERACADLLGHGSTNMVRAVYGHLDQATLAAAVARI
jgi:integrase